MPNNNEELAKKIYHGLVQRVDYKYNVTNEINEAFNHFKQDADCNDEIDDIDEYPDIKTLTRERLEHDAKSAVDDYRYHHKLNISANNRLHIICAVKTLLSKHIGFDEEYSYVPHLNTQAEIIEALKKGNTISGVIYEE